jgi:hypothetical protein
MTVTPIPIRGLLLRFRLSKGPIIFVSLAQILTVGTVFVAIPIVIVPVAMVVDPVVVFIVSMVVFLASIVLRLCRSGNCCGGSKSCGKNKETEEISISTVHVVILLAQDFLSESLARNECAVNSLGKDVRYRTHLLRSLEFAPGEDRSSYREPIGPPTRKHSAAGAALIDCPLQPDGAFAEFNSTNLARLDAGCGEYCGNESRLAMLIGSLIGSCYLLEHNILDVYGTGQFA